MMKLSSWLLEAVSGFLESSERDAVRGDMVELGKTDGQALREIGGLVARRYAAAWLRGGPWAALLGVAVPLGVVLSIASRWWAYSSANFAWHWVQNAEWSYFQNPGWRGDLISLVTRMPLDYLTLACWSWPVGFVLGRLSRRTAWINGGLFCVLLFFGTMETTATGRATPVDAAAFDWIAKRDVLSAVVRIVFVVGPVGFGIRAGQEGTRLLLVPTFLWTLVALGLTVRAVGMLENSLIFGWRPVDEFARFGFRSLPFPRWLDSGPDGFVRSADDMVAWQLRILPAMILWPTLYVFILAARRRLRGTART